MEEINYSKISENLVRKLLTRDALDRKRRSWRLLSDKEMEMMWEQTRFIRFQFPESFKEAGDLAIQLNSPYPLKGSTTDLSWKEQQKKMILNLEDWFPPITNLLNHFHGKLFACGGAIFKSRSHGIHDGYIRSNYMDLDLFFVDSDPDSEKQNKLLEDVLTFLSDNVPNKQSTGVFMTRNQNTITVYKIFSQPDVESHQYFVKYQFILRIYPSLGSILGGFDLGPCMVAYDGKRILSTEFGAWSSMSSTVIVDTTRRSTSYERRLNKYSKHCIVIFTGLSANSISNVLQNHIPREELIKLLEKQIFDAGYKYDKYKWLIPIGAKKKEDVEEEVERMVQSSGYKLEALHITQVLEEPKVPKEELVETLKETAKKHGYFFKYNEDSFSEHCSENLGTNLKIELPYVNLRIDTHYKIGHSKGTFFIFSYGGDYWRGRKNINPKNVSDYGDNMCHPYLTIHKNITSLVHNHLDYTCTFVFLLNPLSSTEEISADLEGDKRLLQGFESIPNDCIFTAESEEQTRDAIRKLLCETSLGPVEEIRQENLKEKRHLEEHGGLEFETLNFRLYAKRNFAEYGKTLFDTIMEKSENIFSIARYMNDPKIQEIESIISERVRKNLSNAKQNLSQINWIINNPGRQWTSSINPILLDPRDWYGEHYRSFRICDYDIEITLRVIRNRKDSALSMIGKDLFEMLLFQIFY